jgi:anthranilate phosphoribosyltransferase
MIKEAIFKIVSKEDLSYEEAKTVMLEIMNGETTATQNAAFLAALSTKSTKAETIPEISGCAYAMRSLATPVEHPVMEVLEIVGTGGDNARTFNISTTSAMIAAAAGIKVAKHGNRAASSDSGAADCLEALGVNIRQSPDLCRKLLKEVGVCFMFAQDFLDAKLSYQSFRNALTAGDHNRQFVLKSNRAFDRIVFNGYKPAFGEDSYPGGRSREIRSVKSIAPAAGSGDFFITDMIRKEIRPYDMRLR